MRWNRSLMAYPSLDPSLVTVAGLTEGAELIVRMCRLQENEVRELWTVRSPGPIYFPTLSGFAWTSDNRHLIYHRKPTGAGFQVWTIAVAMGQARQLEPAISKLNRMVGVHPDGKQLFFLAWNEGVSEVWVMENFLPPMTVAK